MTHASEQTAGHAADDRAGGDAARWTAVWGLMLCAFVVNASEFMPVGLISPIASTLDLSDGQMGQANAVSGLFAGATSLFLGRIVGTTDRRFVLLGLMGVLLVADLVVGLAANPPMLMVGRALLGTVVGGFWSISASIAMRLVGKQAVPSAMAIINGGSALGAALTGPVGSYVGHMLGWRGAFFGVAPFVVVAILWQLKALPALPLDRKPNGRALLRLVRRRPIQLGLASVALYYAGQYSLFTYLRPFLEQVTGVHGAGLSAMLLVVGLAGLAGAAIVGKLLTDRTLYLILGVLPAAMAATAVAFTLAGDSRWAMAVLLAVWGFTGTAAPAAWWTWLARSAPDDAEAGGGLLVAVLQAAIALGAAGGGIAYDRLGAKPEFLCSAALLVATAATVVLLYRQRSADAG